MKKHAVAGLLLFVCISPVAAQAQSGDRVRMGEDITIEEGESAGDVVCVGCNIRVRGSAVAATTRENTGWAFLAGLGAIVGSLILLMLAATTGPFAPVLALLVCLLFTAALVVGYTGLSSWLGRSLFREGSALSAVLLGALVITLLQLIPLAGLLVFLAFCLLALGTVALSGFGTSPGWLQNRFVTSRPAPPPAD